MWSTEGTYLSEISQKLNADKLKLRLIEACFGTQQSVAD